MRWDGQWMQGFPGTCRNRDTWVRLWFLELDIWCLVIRYWILRQYQAMIEDWVMERGLFGYEEEVPGYQLNFLRLISRICSQILGYPYCSFLSFGNHVVLAWHCIYHTCHALYQNWLYKFMLSGVRLVFIIQNMIWSWLNPNSFLAIHFNQKKRIPFRQRYPQPIHHQGNNILSFNPL